MFKKLWTIYFVMSLLLLLFTGCSNANAESTGDSETLSYATDETEEDILTSESIQQLAEDSIMDKYEEAADIVFEDYESIDDIGYLAFSFENDQSQYFGFIVAEKEDDIFELSYLEESLNYEDEQIVIFQWVGSYPGTEDQVIHITAGYVNDDEIVQVTLYYPDSNITVVQLAEDQYGFIDIDVNSNDSLVKVECESSDGDVIYQYEW